MRITIKPGVGRRVPMPAGYGLRHGELLPAEGMEVERTALILKMLADGDVVRVDVAAADAPATAAAPDFHAYPSDQEGTAT